MKYFIPLLLFSFVSVYAQKEDMPTPGTPDKITYEEFVEEEEETFPHSKTTLTLGLGLDLGGFGGKITRYITNEFGVFGGVGYSFVDLGYAFGVEYRFAGKSPKKFTPYLSAFYGTNAFLTLEDEQSGTVIFEEVYLGPSLGFGLRYTSEPNGSTAWDFGIILPFRDPNFQRDVDALKAIGATFENDPLPIAIKVSYTISFNRFTK